MGIRVHKMLGYGLTDLVKDDPRLNPNGICGSWDEKWEDLDAYLKWVAQHSAERHNWTQIFVDVILKDKPKAAMDLQPFYCCVRGTVDGGLENVLCIRPVHDIKWQRSDDTIDWIEESYLAKVWAPGNQADWVQVLTDGIYPYNGLFMNAHSGEEFRGDEAEKVRLWRRVNSPDWGSVPDEDTLQKIATALFQSNPHDIDAMIAPMVPEEIRNLCLWGEAFVDPATVLSLRPMIYCYWS